MGLLKRLGCSHHYEEGGLVNFLNGAHEYICLKCNKRIERVVAPVNWLVNNKQVVGYYTPIDIAPCEYGAANTNKGSMPFDSDFGTMKPSQIIFVMLEKAMRRTDIHGTPEFGITPDGVIWHHKDLAQRIDEYVERLTTTQTIEPIKLRKETYE